MLLFCAVMLSACVIPPTPPSESSYVYRVGPGDRLSIEVWNEPGLDKREVTVTPDGEISFPLVTGTINVTDATLTDVATAVREKVLNVLNDPVVTVTLLESVSAQVQVLGELKKQGRVAYRRNLTLIGALGESGGIDWANAKIGDIRVVRGALSNPLLYEVDLAALLKGKARDFLLEPGDIVVVPTKWVTRYARYMTQLLAPVGVAAGAASTASGVAYGPGGLSNNNNNP